MKHLLFSSLTALASLAMPAISLAQTPGATTPTTQTPDTATPDATTPGATTLEPAPEAPLAPQPDAPARRYARGSISLAGRLDLNFGANASNGGFSFGGGTSAAARFVLPAGFAVDVTFGANFNCYGCTRASTPDRPTWHSVGVGGSIGVGWAFAVSDRVAITPLVRYGVWGGYNSSISGSSAGPSAYHRVSVELPVRVYVTRSVYLEPGLIAEYNRSDLGARGYLAVMQSFGVTL